MAETPLFRNAADHEFSHASLIKLQAQVFGMEMADTPLPQHTDHKPCHASLILNCRHNCSG
jgi:hypothetical protein